MLLVGGLSLVTFVGSVALGSGAVAPAAGATPKQVAAHVTFTPSSSPAYAADAADPNVLYSAGTYYAFTTGTPAGNYIQALTDTSGSPASGWQPYTGGSGSSALPSPPSWETHNTQTSPGVFNYGGHWVMFYDASVYPNSNDSGHSCISVATAATLSPPVFSDTSTGGLECGTPGVGVLDPSPFVDPATGIAYLLWKSNDGGGSAAPSQIWSAQLSASGTSIVGTPTVLLTVDQPLLPWETTTDDPQMAFAAGTYNLLFSGGDFTTSSYNEALTTCSGPLGPCSQPTAPFLTTYGTAYGPGGGALFQDAQGNWWLGYAAWSLPCTSYSCGAVRELYTAPIDLSNGLSVPCNPPSGVPAGYRFTASDGGIFTYGNQPFCGSTGGIHINQPVVGIANTADDGGYWTVARDGGIFSFGDAQFYGSAGSIHLNQPIVGMAATPNSGGYWLVASDGGIFSYGNAKFYGSTGSIHLNKPIVGMASTPDGGGYWLVASDGGIFSYGDATFYGSTGSIHLNQPIVGMSASSSGHGYWLVASDGGIFNYGDATFYGSSGSIRLNRPIVGLAATLSGHGYWLVASDGGIFSYGDAQFYGSTGSIHLNAPIVAMSGP
jgi:hypothetical protein